MFPRDDEIKRNAMHTVDTHRDEEGDCFWLQLALADGANVRHYALQFCLVGGDPTEAEAVSREWLVLCELAASSDDQELIKQRFDSIFPLIHYRQLFNVDPIFKNTTMLESHFSKVRRKADKSKTSARFEDNMLWDSSVITDLRETGRAVWETERASSKARLDSRVVGPAKKTVQQSASDWCYSYGKCHAIMKRIETHHSPMFSDENMAGAPRMRSFKDKNTYSLQDLKLAESLTSMLEEDVLKGAYRRDIPSAEIEARGSEVKSTLQLNSSKEELPMGNRLEQKYSNASAQNLENELKCHLPLSVVAMRAASLEDWLQFRQIKILLAVLLPPFIRGEKKALPCFRSGGGI